MINVNMFFDFMIMIFKNYMFNMYLYGYLKSQVDVHSYKMGIN